MYKKNLLLWASLSGLSMTCAMQQQSVNFDGNQKIEIWHHQVNNLNPPRIRPTKHQIKKALTKGKDLYPNLEQMELISGGIEERIIWTARTEPPNIYATVVLCDGSLAQQKKQKVAVSGFLGGAAVGVLMGGPVGAVIGGVLGGIGGYFAS